MKNYNYTVDWFGRGEDLKQIIKFDSESELHILEIGSFEGRSTIWFLENLLKNPKSTITCVDLSGISSPIKIRFYITYQNLVLKIKL